MRWYGKVLGAILGWLLLRHPAGAVLGGLLGHAFDAGWFDPKSKRQSGPRGPAPEDDYRILGIDAEASDAELDLAYRRLMAQYHPDRVAGAAEEFREMAEQRTRTINAAYDRIRTRRHAAARNSDKA